MKLNIRDFAFVREPELGLMYQNGPFMICVGASSYSCSYRGQVFSWGHESITSAIDAVNKYDRQIRLKLIPSAY